jgi:hypothetical protein
MQISRFSYNEPDNPNGLRDLKDKHKKVAPSAREDQPGTASRPYQLAKAGSARSLGADQWVIC